MIAAEMWHHLVDPAVCLLYSGSLLSLGPFGRPDGKHSLHSNRNIASCRNRCRSCTRPIPIRHHYLVDPAAGLLDFLRDLILAVVLAVPSCGTILDVAAVVHLERRIRIV